MSRRAVCLAPCSFHVSAGTTLLRTLEEDEEEEDAVVVPSDLQAAFRQAAPPRRRRVAPAKTTRDEALRVFDEGESRAGGRARLGLRETAEGNGVGPRRGPRRIAANIPSGDTTVVTIHPGMRSSGTTVTVAIQPPAAQARGAGRRKPPAGAPKQRALAQSLKPVQESGAAVDRAGRPTGKENVPPGGLPAAPGTKGATGKPLGAGRKARPTPLEGRALVGKPTAAAKKRDLNSPLGPPAKREGHTSKILVRKEEASKPSAMAGKPRLRAPASAVASYPLLPESSSQPRMYEDNWLSNQETAIAELVNDLFAAGDRRLEKLAVGSLRRRMTALYQDPLMVLLYKRLQASLAYGALRLPRCKESSDELDRFTADVGLKRRFLALWTRTYRLDLLRCAAEVVIGRGCPSPPESSSGERCQDLESFIESCLLRNEDSYSTDGASTAASWRRTMLRCLMLVMLLDKTKETGAVRSNLFRKGSIHKSSSAVLKELCALLLVSEDLTRPLALLDYHLVHSQKALAEFEYPIRNLAVDLRDGVRMVRMVELLLYASDRPGNDGPDATVTLPSGDVLTTAARHGHNLGVLSQHLKYPCLGKASKLHNVQIALSALQSVPGLASVVGSISAEDVVNGHREKTMALLWSLTSVCGLPMLIDGQDLRQEIRRLHDGRRRQVDGPGPGPVDDSVVVRPEAQGSGEEEQLLRMWAGAIAERNGLVMHDATTAFADGKIFGCIVDEYQRYMPPPPPPGRSPRRRGASLECKLSSLGCSAPFVSIFGRMARGGGGQQLFDRDFTTAVLAFLCSRLLAASKAARVTRAAAKRVADDCKAVVAERYNIIGAAIVLQRTWRRYWAGRMEKLEKGEVDIWLV